MASRRPVRTAPDRRETQAATRAKKHRRWREPAAVPRKEQMALTFGPAQNEPSQGDSRKIRRSEPLADTGPGCRRRCLSRVSRAQSKRQRYRIAERQRLDHGFRELRIGRRPVLSRDALFLEKQQPVGPLLDAAEVTEIDDFSFDSANSSQQCAYRPAESPRSRQAQALVQSRRNQASRSSPAVVGSCLDRFPAVSLRLLLLSTASAWVASDDETARSRRSGSTDQAV